MELESIELKKFKFIKAVSGTVFDMINAIYRDKPLIFIAATGLCLLISIPACVYC